MRISKKRRRVHYAAADILLVIQDTFRNTFAIQNPVF